MESIRSSPIRSSWPGESGKSTAVRLKSSIRRWTSRLFALDVRDDFYLTASRLVPYKKVDVLVDAFGQLPDKRLVVIGDGPELRRLQAKATRNVSLLGCQEAAVLRDYLQRARAFFSPARRFWHRAGRGPGMGHARHRVGGRCHRRSRRARLCCADWCVIRRAVRRPRRPMPSASSSTEEHRIRSTECLASAMRFGVKSAFATISASMSKTSGNASAIGRHLRRTAIRASHDPADPSSLVA